MAIYRIKVLEMKKVLGFYHNNDELRDIVPYTDKETGEDKLRLDIAVYPIPEHIRGDSPWTVEGTKLCLYLATIGGCYWCCEKCNYGLHRCPGCGQDLNHNGIDTSTFKKHEDCT